MIDFIHHVFATNSHVTQAILPLIIGLIAGAAQAMGNSQKEAGQRYEKAAAERLSPWSKLPIPGVQQANPAGDLAAGAFAGLQAQMDNPNGVKGLWNPGGAAPEAAAVPEIGGTSGIGPVADGNAYANLMNPGATSGVGPLANGSAYGSSLNSLQASNKPKGFSPWRFLTGSRG